MPDRLTPEQENYLRALFSGTDACKSLGVSIASQGITHDPEGDRLQIQIAVTLTGPTRTDLSTWLLARLNDATP